MNRRQFMTAAVAGTLALNGMSRPLWASAESGPKLKLGLIGCGWWGMLDLRAAFKAGGVEVVALCDVDEKNLTDSAAEVEKLQGSRPKTFKHYEELLNVPGLEAVILATPPHWHALPFIAAVERNLHVYCEKPLAYDIREAGAMVDAAARKKGVVQVGFQRRQSPALQQAREHIQQGKIGRIIQVDAQIHYRADIRDTTIQDPPATLDWDLWCGPAPKLPYCPQIGHFAWRLEKTTGQGHLVDWGIHLIDAARWILGETTPRSVQASGGIYYFKDKITTPDLLNVQFDFARCPVVWRHRMWGAQEYSPEVSNGLFFYGENGTVFVTDDRWVEIPKGRNVQRTEHKASADTSAVHMAEFLTAVREGKQPSVGMEEGFRSTATVKLAMIAYDTGTKVVWDENTEQIVGNQAGADLLKRPYRGPWRHPHGAA
ncbi:MAG: Gfo/Idh/MocA family oxidoreductase [Phycisphaerae bacterium]|nr:Gfo/Idh/MocA family oxidoreductase [Phycisphaerae bacterium]